MKSKKVLGALMLTAAAVSLFGCKGKTVSNEEDGIKHFTAFFSVPGTEINDDNDIQNQIAELTGVKVKENWLTGQTAQEAVGTMIAGGEFPDFIYGGAGSRQLYESGSLVALDDYIDKYPNIKKFFTEEEWDKIRQDDGHIYWLPSFGNNYGGDTSTTVAEAFWLQTRVLKWGGYPEVKTMDQYFDLIEGYQKAHPTLEDGTPNIPYTILFSGTRTWSLDNAPLFLDGYPNEGSVIVDSEKEQVIDYNTTPTAKTYFKKLNEEYKKGIVDPESFTQSYDEYIAKVSSGRVLGLIDQWWCFRNSKDAIVQQGLDKQGCNYIPLPVTIREDVKNQWYTGGRTLDVSGGVAITKSCTDVEGALQFINDLLSPEVRKLRSWGEKDVDYLVDEDGVFYRTPEMRSLAQDETYKASHLCSYSYFPNYQGGYLEDGINTSSPDDQPNEFFQSLPEDVQECLAAYDCKSYVDMLGRNPVPGPWYPMYSFNGNLTSATKGGTAYLKLSDIKKEYMPRVVMSEEFEQGWEEYMNAYNSCDPQSFINEVQEELERRIELSKKFQEKE